MSDPLADFNALPAPEAERRLLDCCGSEPWARAVLARRPFASAEALLAAADAEWRALPPEQWRAAFRHHPRIGERQATAGQSAAAGAMSASEQGGVQVAATDVRTRLAQGNRSYEERFGFIFIIRAQGRSAEEMLDALTARLDNDPEAELRVAAEQQRQITQLRLRRLLELAT